MDCPRGGGGCDEQSYYLERHDGWGNHALDVWSFIYLLLKHTLLELGAVAAAALTMSGQIFAKPVVPGTCF